MLADKKYPLARQGVFRTIQGEGALLGEPMVFVRLAGCSIGCPECDTDYRKVETVAATEIQRRVESVRGNASWVWVTGGEPADYDLWPLLECLRLCGRVAVATSGAKGLGAGGRLVDFLSVSPHGKPADLVLRSGSQLNLVPGLNGLCLHDWIDFDAGGFQHRYVTPFWHEHGERVEGAEGARRFVDYHPGFKLGVQAHKTWGLP